MVRTLCVWFPDWPLSPGQSDRPCLVVGEPVAGIARVVAADELAKAAGVEVGMARREAENLCPTGMVVRRDLGEEARRFEPVVEAVEGVIPRVEVVEPGLLFVPAGGAVRYFGGEEPLVERIEKELATLHAGARLGLADGPFAARCAAEQAIECPLIVTDTISFLSQLDLATLQLARSSGLREELVSTFRWLGLTTLGDLARLPREALASRFGELGVETHRLASGEDRMPQPRVIPPELAVEDRYEDSLLSLDQVGFAARKLAARLVAGLRAEGIAPHRVSIEAESGDGTVRLRVWRSNDPLTESDLTDRVWWQLRAWLESNSRRPEGDGGIAGGIVRLRLDPADLSGEGRQLTLLEDAAAQVEVERALWRTHALLGPDAVVVGTRQGGRLPGEQVHWRRFGETATAPERDPLAPWPGATPSPSPALVPPELVPFEVEWEDGSPVQVRLSSRWEPVINWSGPWRLLGAWWKGEPAADRYQIVTTAGAFLVLIREGRTFLAGVYD